MILRRTIVFNVLLYFVACDAKLFSFDRLRSYARYIDLYALGWNSTENELWNGIINDCSRRMSFSCIQKNAYAYLDNTFVERDNITVFDGFVLRKNNLDYDGLFERSKNSENVTENLVEGSGDDEQTNDLLESRIDPESDENQAEEHLSPLEEITSSLRDKAVKFLSTRDYELQLPDYFFEGSTLKISPRDIDDKGALIRVDFGQRKVETEGRLFFKKIKKFIKNKLLLSFFALILLIKLIKVKFFFVVPFLFGIGAAKKLFLKVLLFFVPAFAHVFKLCSSYYSSQAHRYHHHHHQVAHHHHHVPVPVPVPTYYSPHSHGDDHEGYDYPVPHMQLRKDLAELKEWGIGDDQIRNDDVSSIVDASIPIAPSYSSNPYGPPPPPSSSYGAPPSNSYGAPPSNAYGSPPVNSYGPPPALNAYGAPPARSSNVFNHQDKFAPASSHAQSMAYSGQVDDHAKFNRRTSVQSTASSGTITHVSQIPSGSINIQLPALSTVNVVTPNLSNSAAKTGVKSTTFNVYPQPTKTNSGPTIVRDIARPSQSQMAIKVSPSVSPASGKQTIVYDDPVYGPILQKLDEIFNQMRFVEESCRERLVCSMYKNPTLFSPHSNLVSNELSRDPQELNDGNSASSSSQRFHRYFAAARLGQDGGDCLRIYPCAINTE